MCHLASLLLDTTLVVVTSLYGALSSADRDFTSMSRVEGCCSSYCTLVGIRLRL